MTTLGRTVLLALIVAFALVVVAAGDDWPQWRGRAQDGSAADDRVFSRPFRLRLAWSRAIGAGYSGVSIVDDKVVTVFTDGVTEFVGAFAAETGDELWRVDLGEAYQGRHGSEDGSSSTPAIAGGRVFALSGHGRLTAVDLDDGRQLWRVDLVAEHDAVTPWYGFGASPVPTGDVVYLSVFTRQGVSGMAFAAETGELAWTVRGNWLDYHPAIESRAGEGLLVADGSDLALVDTSTGEERFRFNHAQDADLAYPQLLPVETDRLLLTYEPHADLYRLGPDGEPLELVWRSRELRDCYTPPVHHDGVIYGLSGIFLVAVDAATGERLWKSRRPGARSLILVDGHLVLLSSGGEVVVAAASPDGYREVASVQATDRGGYTSPSFAGEGIVVRNTSHLARVEVVPAVATPPADVAAAGTAPPGPFRDFVESLADAADPTPLLDAWWSRQTRFPVVEGDAVVHFVFRGSLHEGGAREVALLGDMTEDSHLPEALHRVGDTDLFYRSYAYERSGVWSYSFLIDLERVVTDPMNPLTVAGFPQQNPVSVGFELPEVQSIVRMPGWEPAAFLEDAAGGGRLELVPFESPTAYRQRDLTVYLPAGYAPADSEAVGYAALYVLGSGPWLEHAKLVNALDNLMGSAARPAVVVLVPYHDGSWDRMGADSYADMMLDEIVPLIEGRYPIAGPSLLLAAGDDAQSALVLALRAPGKFPRLALHSPRIPAADFSGVPPGAAAPEAAFIEWSRYEPRIHDENLDYRALAERTAELLRRAGTTVVSAELATGPGWTSWGARLDRSLAFLLPPDGPAESAGTAGR